MHPIRHPRYAIIIGVVFVVVATLYWLTAYVSDVHIDYAGVTMLGALGIAMGLMFYVLFAGSPDD